MENKRIHRRRFYHRVHREHRAEGVAEGEEDSMQKRPAKLRISVWSTWEKENGAVF
jgi:hypothetical protein